MKKKAIEFRNFLKKAWNLIWDFAKRYTEIIAIIIIVVLIRCTLIFNKNDSKDLDGTLIGVVFALVVGLKQIYISNKNMEDNIQIRKAEFTIKFIKDFQKLMPEMDFCSYLYGNFNDHCEEEKTKELQKKLLEVNKFDFSIREYNKLKRKLDIDDNVIDEARDKFKKNTVAIISIADAHYKEKGLSEFCSFHQLRNDYLSEKKIVDANKKLFFTQKDYEDKIKDLEERYVNSIFVNIKNIVNELECNTLSVQFDLLDYDKITNLIYVPLHYYISNLYIVMMENKIEHEKSNYFIYSNIKRFCTEILKIKEQIDTEIDEENSESETRKEKKISNSTKTKKL